MMKKIAYIFLILSATLQLSSCVSLDLNPPAAASSRTAEFIFIPNYMNSAFVVLTYSSTLGIQTQYSRMIYENSLGANTSIISFVESSNCFPLTGSA